MVKAGKECKGFTPDDEAKPATQLQSDQQEELHRRAILIQALYRGWKARKAWREQKLAAAETPPEPGDPESCASPAAEITRSAAVQYVFNHGILDLFKNLLSRLFYTKPENVREFLISELSKIDEIRRLSATQAAEGAAAASNGTPPSENLQNLESAAADKELGIFDVNDFQVYFHLLSGDEKDNIPSAQLMRSMGRFCCKAESERVLAKHKVELEGVVGEATFSRVMEESVCSFYDISRWTQASEPSPCLTAPLV